jgi:hypothetical protein
MNIELRYTLADYTVSTVDLAKWVGTKLPKFTAGERLCVARALQSGQGWEPPYGEVNDAANSGPCKVALTSWNETDSQVKYFDSQSEYRKLLEAGANGDVESAIAYCKLELEGKIGHSAMA